MNKDLTEKLFKRFEFLNKNSNGRTPFYLFSFECGNGWFKLIWKLCENIEKELKKNSNDNFEVVQIKEKYGCYDKSTEVLTEKGWKFFKDIKINDEICTLGKNNIIEYQKVIDIIKYKYKGKMYRLKTRGVDLLVTPNHNLYVAKGTYYNGKYNPPKKVKYDFELTTPYKYFGINKRFLKSIIPKHDSYNINWLLKSNEHNTQNKGLGKTSVEKWIDYNDYVYCVTVPNHIIFIRRKGIPIWCGNSLRYYVTTANDKIFNLIDKAESKSLRICENCGKRGKSNIEGWIKTLCKKCNNEY